MIFQEFRASPRTLPCTWKIDLEYHPGLNHKNKWESWFSYYHFLSPWLPHCQPHELCCCLCHHHISVAAVLIARRQRLQVRQFPHQASDKSQISSVAWSHLEMWRTRAITRAGWGWRPLKGEARWKMGRTEANTGARKYDFKTHCF